MADPSLYKFPESHKTLEPDASAPGATVDGRFRDLFSATRFATPKDCARYMERKYEFSLRHVQQIYEGASGFVATQSWPGNSPPRGEEDCFLANFEWHLSAKNGDQFVVDPAHRDRLGEEAAAKNLGPAFRARGLVWFFRAAAAGHAGRGDRSVDLWEDRWELMSAKTTGTAVWCREIVDVSLDEADEELVKELCRVFEGTERSNVE